MKTPQKVQRAVKPAPKKLIPHPTQKGAWIPNPDHPANKMELFKEYKAVVGTAHSFASAGVWAGVECTVKKMPSGKVQLSYRGKVISNDAQEGKDFKLA